VIDKQREKFEEWFAAQKHHVVAKEIAWQAWQAAIASIEITLPSPAIEIMICNPDQSWGKESEMVESWSKATAHNEWKEKVLEAARKWVKCKGRYHSEINTKALIELFEQEPRND